jgi:regulator of CtrA degradation
MALLPSLNPRIIEALHLDALRLAEQVRACFEQLRRETMPVGPRSANDDENPDLQEDLARVQLSCEALRATTRVMHCLAWLLNHRAFFAGELSVLQLRRHGRLVANFPMSEPDIVASLPHEAQFCVHESERLYERIQRLEHNWRGHPAQTVSAIQQLRERLGAEVAGPI